MRAAAALAVGAALVASASAAAQKNYLGFNSGATLADRSAKFKADFLAEFKTAQALSGAPGTFNAVRLYTNIQAYSTSDPIQAFEAAVETKTYILLGVWTSGTDNIDNELGALQKAIDQYGTDLTDLIIGISIGSEDLYRISVTGIENKSGVGAGPEVIVNFINTYKEKFAKTALADVPIGHVDTWDAWTNTTNKPVIDAVDWIGVDEYPFYETGKGNSIKNAGTLFDTAYGATIGVAGGKPVWVTETGWPYTGPTWDEAVPSVEDAKIYWDEVGCRKLFNKTPTFWYNLRDSNPDNEVKFAITNNLSSSPRFNLTCPTTFDTPSSTSRSSSSSSAAATTSSSSGGSKTSVSVPTSTASSESGSKASGSPGSDSSSSAPDSSAATGSSSSTGASSTPTTGASSTPATVADSAAAPGYAYPAAAYAGLAAAAALLALF